ncbi:IS1182 family transposase [Bradyrhizobium sp.]|uniref:IS1182 family transposase n=1 Tax=Bradyrhizobium sp. TaxID=376 RepID=UPI001DEDD98C|nr:IS1182 family transposase [Bradyrhizobium sp.]MBV8701752.1 IS1182 family transposase [Bradyrhizobium sp.]MBV9979945.1 IS1182 family transposase [Bradyrhizobium sp.]
MSEARVIRPDRAQTRWDFIDLEAMLPPDHRARVVWSFVESLELTELYDAIKSREGEAGRPAADPAVLLALWLYATVEGVGSARELDRLTERDLAYRWIAGGVPVNYHGLADFRVAHTAVLDRLLTESVTVLIAQGLVSLDEIAIDGTKVRANASRESFKTAAKLDQIEAKVAARLGALKAEIDHAPDASMRRRRAARERAAQDVKQRAAKARQALEQIRAEKAERAKTHAKDEAKKSEPRVSLSDVDARSMRFADGAVRPAYNAQIAAVPREGVIVSIRMTDRRNDSGLAAPMIEDVVRRYGRVPAKLLVDTHYATAEDIAMLAEHPAGPVAVYAPTPSERSDNEITAGALRNRRYRRRHEPQGVKDWRDRMATAAGKAIYATRKLIERVNADCKNHGFGYLHLRGLFKVQSEALLHALANNLMAAQRLRREVV